MLCLVTKVFENVQCWAFDGIPFNFISVWLDQAVGEQWVPASILLVDRRIGNYSFTEIVTAYIGQQTRLNLSKLMPNCPWLCLSFIHRQSVYVSGTDGDDYHNCVRVFTVKQTVNSFVAVFFCQTIQTHAIFKWQKVQISICYLVVSGHTKNAYSYVYKMLDERAKNRNRETLLSVRRWKQRAYCTMCIAHGLFTTGAIRFFNFRYFDISKGRSLQFRPLVLTLSANFRAMLWKCSLRTAIWQTGTCGNTVWP